MTAPNEKFAPKKRPRPQKNYNPQSQIAKGGHLTEEIYNQAIEFYRKKPGAKCECARACSISIHTATRIWEGKRNPSQPWFIPAKIVLGYKSDEELRREAEQFNEIKKEACREEALKLAEKERKLREEAIKIQEDILTIANRNVINGLVGLARLTDGINAISARINDELLIASKDKKKQLPITVPEFMLVFQRWQQSSKGLIEAANTLIQIERLRNNLPTAILGLELQNISLDDAERECKEAEKALQRAQQLGLVALSGGKR